MPLEFVEMPMTPEETEKIGARNNRIEEVSDKLLLLAPRIHS